MSEAPRLWMEQAACKGQGDLMYPTHPEAKPDYRPARAICRSCPVRIECLEYALDNREEFGMWGGLTYEERRPLLRKRLAAVNRHTTRLRELVCTKCLRVFRIEHAVGNHPRFCDECISPESLAQRLRRAGPGTTDMKRDPSEMCVNGHEWTEWNTMTCKQGKKRCRACMVIRKRAYRAERRKAREEGAA